MKESRFEAQVWLLRPLEEVFAFFAEPRNLDAITPRWLKFEILSAGPITMRAGTLLDYRIRVHGIPVHWRSKIATWEPPHRFVDEQLRGPYARWHHTHIFEEQDQGTLCRDEVRYWPRGGRLADWLFVRRDLKQIFQYREQRLREILRPCPK